MDENEARKKFELADELYRDKRYTEALTVLDKLEAAFPNAKNVMYPRALCLAKLGRPKEAHEVCMKLKALYNDPRADKLMHKLSESIPLAQPPIDAGMFSRPGGLDAGPGFNPMDLSNIGPIEGAPGVGDPMGLGDLFAPKPGAAPPPLVTQGPTRKPLYIALGVAGGVFLLLLIGLPLFVGGGGRSDDGAEPEAQTGSTAEALPQDIYWFNSYETAENAYYASDTYAPALIFFYNSESETATRMMEETWKEPSIAYLVQGWTCVRIDIEADPETAALYEITEVPTTIVEDDWFGLTVYEQSGFVSAQDFYNAIQPLNLEVEEVIDFTKFTIAQYLVVVLLWICSSGGSMYLTLLMVRKLPNDEFLKDIVSAGLVGVGVSVLFGCPCIGIVAVYFILRAVYEFEIIDYVAYLGVSTVVGALTTVLVAGVLGLPVEELIALYV